MHAIVKEQTKSAELYYFFLFIFPFSAGGGKELVCFRPKAKYPSIEGHVSFVRQLNSRVCASKSIPKQLFSLLVWTVWNFFSSIAFNRKTCITGKIKKKKKFKSWMKSSIIQTPKNKQQPAANISEMSEPKETNWHRESRKTLKFVARLPLIALRSCHIELCAPLDIFSYEKFKQSSSTSVERRDVKSVQSKFCFCFASPSLTQMNRNNETITFFDLIVNSTTNEMSNHCIDCSCLHFSRIQSISHCSIWHRSFWIISTYFSLIFIVHAVEMRASLDRQRQFRKYTEIYHWHNSICIVPFSTTTFLSFSHSSEQASGSRACNIYGIGFSQWCEGKNGRRNMFCVSSFLIRSRLKMVGGFFLSFSIVLRSNGVRKSSNEINIESKLNEKKKH